MNQEPSRIQKKLENVKPPHVQIPLHQRQLKMDLLKMHEQMRQHPFTPFNFNNFMKKLLPLSMVALLAVVVVLNGTGILSSSTASAKELLEQAIAKVKVQVEKNDVTAAQKLQELQNELSVLEKAENAKDLALAGEEKNDGKGTFKKLSFTDENGKKVTIKYDEEDHEDPVDVEEDGGQEEEKNAAVTQEARESESQENATKPETEIREQSEANESNESGESKEVQSEPSEAEKKAAENVSTETPKEASELPETSKTE